LLEEKFVNILVFIILSFLMGCSYVFALETKSLDKFMDNAVFDAWNPDTNDVLFLRKDEKEFCSSLKSKKTQKSRNRTRYASAAIHSGQLASSYP
jgi:hypothetical protein